MLMTVITGLFLLVGHIIGGQQGMIVALVLAAGMNFASYWFSDRIVLALYGAKQIDESQAPQLFNTVRRLTVQAGMPMPKVYVIPADQPNAFATGRDPNHAAVAVTQGITRILNEDELEGVLAHELAHVRNRDILIGSIAATLAGAVMMISRMALFFGGGRDDNRGGGNAIVALLVMILAPIAALLIQMAISRSREYGADEGGARISGKPWALASALQKLERSARAMPMESNPATAHMFIVNPFSARGMAGLFSTHPPIPERVARLRRLGDSAV